MSENFIDEEKDESVIENSSVTENTSRKKFLVTGVTIAIIALLFLSVGTWLLMRNSSSKAASEKETAESKHEGEEGKEVKLSSDVLESAKFEYEGVTQRPAVAFLKVTGTVENNQEQTQVITTLVSGRVERVNVALGDRVKAGDVLAIISSPQIAQMHGKLHEAETRLALAQRNLERVQRTENRVAVLQAKVKLDEAEANLRRIRKLVEIGAGAGKDLVAAEANYKTAKAEYDFQNNISLNKELQEAKAEVETSRVDVKHIRDEMRALGVNIPEGEHDDNHKNNTSFVLMRASASGVVTERLVNPGAGIEVGKPLFTISNISSVWVVANVPEASISTLTIGSFAEIRSAALKTTINGRVSYIDPQLNEETRTARVRVVVDNPGERLKAGMFVEVGFQTSTGKATGEELMVSSAAVQRVGDKTIIFIPKDDEPGAFEAREVELGGEVNGYHRVLSGLKLGDKVVTKGSFTLKTQLEKGSMEDDH
jgi:cobalt-zinc-cadmium efflux system membrane fusion protein